MLAPAETRAPSFFRARPWSLGCQLPSASGSGAVGAVHNDLGSFERDEPTADHLIELRQDCLDAFFRFHTFHDYREIDRQAQDLVGM